MPRRSEEPENPLSPELQAQVREVVETCWKQLTQRPSAREQKLQEAVLATFGEVKRILAEKKAEEAE